MKKVKLIGGLVGATVLATSATVANSSIFQNGNQTRAEGRTDYYYQGGTPKWSAIDPEDWDKWCDVNSTQTSTNAVRYTNRFYGDKPEYNYGICAAVLKGDYGVIDGKIVSATSGSDGGYSTNNDLANVDFIVTETGSVWRLTSDSLPSKV